MTTTEAIADVILTPWLSEFMEGHPHTKLEIFATERRLDLLGGEADIAIRPIYKPTEAGFVTRRLAEGRWTLYCSCEYARKHGKPACANDLNNHVVIGAEDSFAKLEPLIWLAKAASQATIRTVCGTVSSTFVAIRTGHGIGALPSLIGAHPELTECSIMPGFDFGFYLVTPDSLKDVPCVKAFTAFIMARAPALKRALEAGPRAN